MSPRPKTKPGSGALQPPPDPASAEFPAALAAWRKVANLTQAQLAEIVGCRQEQISRWERGIEAPAEGSLRSYESLRFGELSKALAKEAEDLVCRMEAVRQIEGRIFETGRAPGVRFVKFC